jgi:hypothetical protein
MAAAVPGGAPGTIDAELVAFGICECGEAGAIGQYGAAQPGQLVDELLVLA